MKQLVTGRVALVYLVLLLPVTLITNGCSDKSPETYGVYVKKGGNLQPLGRFEESWSLEAAAKKALNQETIKVAGKDEIIFYQEGISPSKIELANAMTAEKLGATIQPAKKQGMYVLKLESLPAGKYFIFVDNASGFTAWCWGTFEME